MRFSLSSPGIALGLVVLAMSLIPLNDVAIKLMSDRISLPQVLVLRSALILLIAIFLPGVFHNLRTMSLKTWSMLLLRGALLTVAMITYFIGLGFMDLWQATAIFFVSPLLISLLSIPILKERLGLWRSLALVIGFVGVLLIAIPGSKGGFNWTFLLPFLAAIYYAFFQLLTRLIRESSDAPTMAAIQQMAYAGVGAILGLIIYLMPFEQVINQMDPALAFVLRDWPLPTAKEWVWFAGCGLVILLLSFAAANAYRHLEATLVAPFEYIALPFAVLWSGLIWGNWPEIYGWIGIGLILFAGLLVVFRENAQDVEVASAMPMPMAAGSQIAEFEETSA